MPVKYWSFAGLLLTYWCNARCASCYVCSAPSEGGDMTVEAGLRLWAGLQAASPHGCRIHIGGGEPFGRWEALIGLARQAQAAGLGPLEAVETNAYWATDEGLVRDRLGALDAAGLGRLTISADPYHQQFVPIERVRLAERVGREILGPERVRVRWRDWAAGAVDIAAMASSERRAVFAAWARRGHDRLTGRAAAEIAAHLPLKPTAAFADNPCGQRLLRSRHVHVDGDGIVCPGTCAGIVLGRADSPESVGAIWRALQRDHARMDVIGPLARAGPVAMLAEAEGCGYRPREGYASKCHLCYDVRRHLFGLGRFGDRLGPGVVYRP